MFSIFRKKPPITLVRLERDKGERALWTATLSNGEVFRGCGSSWVKPNYGGSAPSHWAVFFCTMVDTANVNGVQIVEFVDGKVVERA